MSESPDRSIDRLARRQHGAFNRTQAGACGFSDRMIAQRVSSGTWLRLEPGVYALASHPFTWERQAMAATLTLERAVLSGRAAAALHELDGFPRGSVEIMVPPTCKGSTRLATVRRSGFMEVTRVRGIPCLTIIHTILSLAGRVTSEQLDCAVDDALARRLVTLDDLRAAFAEWAPRRRHGAGTLRAVLQAKGDDFVPPTSQLERKLRSFLDAPDLPAFSFEYELPWWPRGEGRVDAYAPSCTLIVEADGRAWHVRERNMANDRHRDNLATANGHGTLRFTWDDLTRGVVASGQLLRQTISERAGRGASRSR